MLSSTLGVHGSGACFRRSLRSFSRTRNGYANTQNGYESYASDQGGAISDEERRGRAVLSNPAARALAAVRAARARVCDVRADRAGRIGVGGRAAGATAPARLQVARRDRRRPFQALSGESGRADLPGAVLDRREDCARAGWQRSLRRCAVMTAVWVIELDVLRRVRGRVHRSARSPGRTPVARIGMTASRPRSALAT